MVLVTVAGVEIVLVLSLLYAFFFIFTSVCSMPCFVMVAFFNHFF